MQQQLLQNQKEKITLQNHRCSSNNPASFLCISEECEKCALICGKADCKCSTDDHSSCSFTSGQKLIQTIVAKKSTAPGQIIKVIDSILKVYDEAIERLSGDRQKIMVWKQNYKLNWEQVLFMTALKQNNREDIKGSLINKIKSKIDIEQNYEGINQDTVVKTWQNLRDKFNQTFNRFYHMIYPEPGVCKMKKLNYQFDMSSEMARNNVKYNQQENSFENISGQQTFHLASMEQVPKQGIHFYDIQLADSKGGYIATGIVTQSIKHQKFTYNRPQSIKFWALGDLDKDSKQQHNNPKIFDGSIVRTVIDMVHKRVCWKVGQYTIKTALMCQSFLNQPVYVSIEIGNSKGIKFIKI